jgi:hypothetical protein
MNGALGIWPWESEGSKPFHTNEEGFEWWLDDSMQRYIDQDFPKPKLKDTMACLVRKGDDVTRVIINDKQELLYSNKSLEAVACWVDMAKTKQQFDKNQL